MITRLVTRVLRPWLKVVWDEGRSAGVETVATGERISNPYRKDLWR